MLSINATNVTLYYMPGPEPNLAEISRRTSFYDLILHVQARSASIDIYENRVLTTIFDNDLIPGVTGPSNEE